MFKISDFSRFTRVSVKALRHYDRLGILRPAHVDPQNHYRYYSARQVSRLQRILALRELGFSLEHVADILAAESSRTTLRRLLEMRRTEIERQLALDRERLAQLDARLLELDEGTSATLPEAVVQKIPAIRVASRRARVPELDEGVRLLFEAVERDALHAGARAAGPPILIYHDRDHRMVAADVEAAVPVTPDVRRCGRSKVRTLPAMLSAACVTYAGSYDQWTEVLGGLLAWMQTRRLVPAGPSREVYLQFRTREALRLGLPREFLSERSEDLVTEMQIPVARRGGGTP
jgi:DNA-binding transcriptional MerR regulator